MGIGRPHSPQRVALNRRRDVSQFLFVQRGDRFFKISDGPDCQPIIAPAKASAVQIERLGKLTLRNQAAGFRPFDYQRKLRQSLDSDFPHSAKNTSQQAL